MAYSRWSECDWFIFGCDENGGVSFSGPQEKSIFIPGEAIDIFIYKLSEDAEDFAERCARGKQLIEEGKKSRAEEK